MLPPSPTRPGWPGLRRQHDWRPAIAEICRRHGLPSDGLVPAGSGTNVVFAVGQRHFAKLSPPVWRGEVDRELLLLPRVEGRLGVATPAIVASGVLEGPDAPWPYLVVTRVEGVAAEAVWDGLDAGTQRALAGEIGELLRRIHAIEVTGLEPLARDWPRMMAAQMAGCVEHHRQRGATEPWLDQIPGFLARLPPLFPRRFDPVLLNADVHHQHAFLTERDGRWRLTGLIDFDDGMLGFHEYEFVAPVTFLMAGRPDLVRTLLLAYGYRREELDPALRVRLMGYTLLHRYGGFADILREADPRGRCRTLDEVAAALYSFG